MNDWMDHLIAVAQEQGFEVRQTGSGMWLFTNPEGHIVTIPSTPVNVSELRRVIMRLREFGLRPANDEE